MACTPGQIDNEKDEAKTDEIPADGNHHLRHAPFRHIQIIVHPAWEIGVTGREHHRYLGEKANLSQPEVAIGQALIVHPPREVGVQKVEAGECHLTGKSKEHGVEMCRNPIGVVNEIAVRCDLGVKTRGSTAIDQESDRRQLSVVI